jgi:hypothetical protein
MGGTEMINQPWIYSHTQLALWKLCKRRFYNRYVLGKKEPKTPNMAAGTWLVQAPVEDVYATVGLKLQADSPFYWDAIWANFLAEFSGDDSYKDPIFNLNLAKRILAAYKANPVQGKVVEIEKTFYKDFADGYRYSSRSDLIIEVERAKEAFADPFSTRITWDIKLRTFNQSRAGDTFFAKAELSQFDDQCLGQAILAGADAFGQIVFLLGKKDGTLIGPIYLEHRVDAILEVEWLLETEFEIKGIESWKRSSYTYPWPKNDQACHAFGKNCAHLTACNLGFEPLDKSNRKD